MFAFSTLQRSGPASAARREAPLPTKITRCGFPIDTGSASHRDKRRAGSICAVPMSTSTRPRVGLRASTVQGRGPASVSSSTRAVAGRVQPSVAIQRAAHRAPFPHISGMEPSAFCTSIYDDEVLHCPEDGRGLSDIPAVDDLIGRTVGSYRVEKLLGKGGMGCVYMGVHPGIGSRVAIKFLHPQFSHDEKIVDRFFNEARAVNVIGHDNILKILDLNVTDDNRHYFVMEFLHGRPLQALLNHNVSVPLDVA